MRNIFGGAAGPGSDELKERLAQLRESAYQQEKTHRSNLATINARTKAKLDWIERNKSAIQDRYLELVACYESGSDEALDRIIYTSNPTSGFVFSMPALDLDGRTTTFKDWLGDAFPSDTDNTLVKSQIQDDLNSGLTPAFEEIELTENPVRPFYEEIESTFISRATGGYAEELQNAVKLVQSQIQTNETLFDIAEKDAIESGERQIREKFEEISEEMLGVSVFIRMNEALDADSDTLREIFKTHLPYIFKYNGREETLAWLTEPRDEEEMAPIQRILYKSKYELGDKNHPLYTVLAELPNDIAVANMFLKLAEETEYPLMAKELKELAGDISGDFLRLGSLSLFNPRLMGFVAKNESGIFSANMGHRLETEISEDVSEAVIDYLKYQSGFIAESNIEVTNLTAVTKTHYTADTEGTTKLYTMYFDRKWSEKMDEEKAHEAIARRENDPRFMQLSDKTLIDKNRVIHAWIEPAENNLFEIKYVIGDSEHKIVNIDTERKAHELLDQFAGTSETMAKLTSTEIVDGAAIGNLWIEDEGRGNKLNFIINGDEDYYNAAMSVDQAHETLKVLGKKHNHLKLNDFETINPDRISLIYYHAGDNALKYVIDGKRCKTEMDKELAFRVLKHIEKNYPAFTRHQKEGLINPDLFGRVHYDKGDHKIKYLLGGSQWHSSVSEPAALSVLEALEKRPHYQRLDDKTYINLNVTGSVSYNNDKGCLEYTVNGVKDDEDYYPKVSRDQALKVINAIEAYGKELAKARLAASYEGVELEEYELPPEEMVEQEADSFAAPVAPEQEDEPEDKGPKPLDPFGVPEVF